MFRRLDNWHKTITGLLSFGLVELLIAYGLASLSINNGNLFCYLLTLIFLVGFLQNFFRLIARLIGHQGRRHA